MARICVADERFLYFNNSHGMPQPETLKACLKRSSNASVKMTIIDPMGLHSRSELYAEFAAINRSQAIIDFTLNGEIITANENFLLLMGYQLDEVRGRPHSIFLSPDDNNPQKHEIFWQALRAGEYRTDECLRLKKNGTEIWLQVAYAPVLDQNSRPYKVVMLATDITPQVTARRTLSAVLDTILDALITIDRRGVIASFNPAATRLFGFQPEEVVGQNVAVLMPEPHRAEHDRFLRTYLGTGTARMIGTGRELLAKHKDGRVFPIELGVNEMNVGGRLMFVGTVRDITDRKRADEALAHLLADLTQSNQDLNDFAYIASHDLKEPLRGLGNNALFLKDDLGARLDGNVLRRIERIVYLCQRMEQLIDDLLYFCGLGRKELARQRTDINAVISDIASTMEATLIDKHAKILVPERLPTIVCDHVRITEIFRNLISNALKYNNSPEKLVEIGSEFCKGQYIFSVRDNGIGIPKEFHEEIFRIFKRLNDEDDAVKGTGVGLTFVKKMVERHGGKIWVESRLGSGATFRFSIPNLTEASI